MARILLLTPQLPIPPQALTGMSQGTTIRNYYILAGLAQRHVVDLLSFCQPTADRRSPTGEFELLRPYCRQIVAEPTPVRTLARRMRDTLLSPLPDMALRLAAPVLHAHLARLLNENRYDVVQVEGIEMAPYALDFRSLADFGNLPPPRLVFDDHNAEYILQQRAFLTDVRRPQRWPGALSSSPPSSSHR